MECPNCGSRLLSVLSCGCEDVNCKDLFECTECQSVFNMEK